MPNTLIFFTLLTFLSQIRFTTAAASTGSCCSLNRTQLSALKSPNCTSNSFRQEVSKCSPCPEGTCRVGSRCICPSYFLAFTSQQSNCDDSFGSSWPGSIDAEDRDWRSCAPDFTPPPNSSTSCCALSESSLNTLRGTSPNCPSRSYQVKLSKKCQSCPSGTCRFDLSCFCPDYFQASTYHQQRCAPTFKSSWPASSEQQEDRDWRSCAPKFSPPPPTNVSCCAMTKEQLNALRGTSGECPSVRNFVLALGEKCQNCPSGTCRVESDCLCPAHFLESTVRQADCVPSFVSAWPASIEKEDRDHRSCLPDFKPPASSIKSCCALSKGELGDLRGRSDKCPGSSFQLLSQKCQLCPPGRCRVDMVCRCPDHFLASIGSQASCEKSFGEAWPLSVPKVDKEWQVCNGTATPTAPVPTTTSTSPSKTTAATTKTASGTGSGSNSNPSPEQENSSAVPNNPSGSEGSKGGSPDGNLTVLEIVGIVAGVVSTVIAAGSVVVGVLKWRSKRQPTTAPLLS